MSDRQNARGKFRTSFNQQTLKQTIRPLQISETANPFEGEGKSVPRFRPEPEVELIKLQGHAAAIPHVIDARLAVQPLAGSEVVADRQTGG